MEKSRTNRRNIAQHRRTKTKEKKRSLLNEMREASRGGNQSELWALLKRLKQGNQEKNKNEGYKKKDGNTTRDVEEITGKWRAVGREL